LFLVNDTSTTYIYTLSLHDALPISFRIPQIPKRRTLSPATGHNRDRHRSRSRSRTSQRSTGSKASRRSRPSESPEYSPSDRGRRSEEHTSELQSQSNLVCRLLLEKK